MKLMEIRTLGAFLALCLLAGCGDTGNDEGDAAVADGPSGDAADAWQTGGDTGPEVCNTLENAAAEIIVRHDTRPPPQAAGGTVQDGLYFLVADVFYNAPADMDLGAEQATSQISGATLEQSLLMQGREPEAASSTFVTAGESGITFNQTCPDPLEWPWDAYTAGGTTLELHHTATSRVQTWELQ